MPTEKMGRKPRTELRCVPHRGQPHYVQPSDTMHVYYPKSKVRCQMHHLSGKGPYIIKRILLWPGCLQEWVHPDGSHTFEVKTHKEPLNDDQTYDTLEEAVRRAAWTFKERDENWITETYCRFEYYIHSEAPAGYTNLQLTPEAYEYGMAQKDSARARKNAKRTSRTIEKTLAVNKAALMAQLPLPIRPVEEEELEEEVEPETEPEEELEEEVEPEEVLEEVTAPSPSTPLSRPAFSPRRLLPPRPKLELPQLPWETRFQLVSGNISRCEKEIFDILKNIETRKGELKELRVKENELRVIEIQLRAKEDQLREYLNRRAVLNAQKGA
jgi:hypothetical protein